MALTVAALEQSSKVDAKTEQNAYGSPISPAQASTRAPSTPVRSLWLGSDSDSDLDVDSILREGNHDGIAIVRNGLYELQIPLLATERLPLGAYTYSLRNNDDEDADDDDSEFEPLFSTGRKVVPDMTSLNKTAACPPSPRSPVKTAGKKRRLAVATPTHAKTTEASSVGLTACSAISSTPKRRRLTLVGGC